MRFNRRGYARTARTYHTNYRSGKRSTSTIDIKKMIHDGIPPEMTQYMSERSFNDFPLHPKLKINLEKAGYIHPTEIQDRTFEAVSGVNDVIGIATTGTGKTGAFLIPIINSLLTEKALFETLVLVPTRELALQIEEEFKKLARQLNLFSVSLIGGQSIQQDISRLKRSYHIIIGTPGRLKDLCLRNELDLKDISVLVLDEFDRMLDMGFSMDLNFLISQIGKRDQTLLFSATIDTNLKSQIDELMYEPLEIKVSSGLVSAEHIAQDVVYATKEDKFSKLLEMVNNASFEKVLVFAETKRNVVRVAKQLDRAGISVDEIHGDKTLGYRKKALNSFKLGKVKVLVATDVASRGLDIDNVTHVINYEIPHDYETYIHRIGRTGRLGKKGFAYTFIN